MLATGLTAPLVETPKYSHLPRGNRPGMSSQQEEAASLARRAAPEPSRQDHGDREKNATTASVLLIPAPDQLETPTRMTIDDLPLTTTVGEIRRLAQAMIASQPDITRLRLIHSGRLLSRDDQTLEQTVTPETLQANRTIAVHLILRPLPGATRPHSRTRAGSPANLAATSVPLPPAQDLAGMNNQATPLLQAAQHHHFPPRPSSTPAVAHAQGPYAAPAPQHGAGGFATYGMPNPQQAQFMQQLQQQHLNMMQAMLRQTPMHPAQPSGTGPPGQPMTLPDFQRMYNQQAQARQAQQAAVSGRTTPQGSGSSGRQGAPSYSSPQPQPEGQNPGDSSSQQHVPLANRTAVQGTAWTSLPHPPRMQLNSFPMPTPLAHSASPGTVPSATAASEYDTVFLLSSPAGHEAILIGPRSHNDHLGGQSRSSSVGANVGRMDPPATAAVLAQQNAVGQQNVPDRAGQPPQPRNLLALIMPFGDQLWLITRLGLVVALLTLNTTWTRTLGIWFVAFIIYLAQTDVLNPVLRAAEQVWVPVRRHIEELVRDVEDRQDATGDNLDPAQVAERLLRRQRDQSLLRRVERGVALFVASFVPGVGEAQVAAREAAERQRQQEEERRRQEEADRVQRQQEELPIDTTPPIADPEMQHTADDPRDAKATGPSGHDEQQSESLRHRQPHVEDSTE